MTKIITSPQNLVTFVLENADTLTDTNEYLLIEGSKNKKVSCMKNGNYNIYFNVTLPEDFRIRKYFYDGNDWTLNEAWTDPALEEEDV